MKAQNMKHHPTDFSLPCWKCLVVALCAITLSGCYIDFTGGGLGDQIRSYQHRLEAEAERDYEPLAQKAFDYLQTACEKDERFFIKPGIALDEDKGVLILRINQGDAFLPLLETAPKKIASPSGIINYRWYWYHDSKEESLRRFREIQYGYFIPWDDEYTLDAVWMTLPPSAIEEKKLFARSGSGKTIQRASKAFWERAGLRERVLKDSSQIKALRNRKVKPLSEAAILIDYEATPMWEPFDLPVDTIHAKYALSIEDISTLEDRAHWVGRGRLRLTDQDTGEIVAEYVGFAANNSKPGMQKESRYWTTTTMCPNVGRMFNRDVYRWAPVRSFLQTIKRAHGKAVPNFDALAPLELEKTPSLSRFTRKDGSIRVENTELAEFIQQTPSYVIFNVPTDRPLPSMVWRNVFLSRSVRLLSAKNNANATIAGNLLIEGVKGDELDLLGFSINGDLTVRDSEFLTRGGLSLAYDAAPHILFERVSGYDMLLKSEKKQNDENDKSGKNNAQAPRNKQTIFRSYAVRETTAYALHSDHVRIENATDSFFDFRGSRIGTLEIIGSKLETLPGYDIWTDLDLRNAEIDRLVITDSYTDAIRLGGTRIAQVKISNSQFKAKRYGDAHIEDLVITNSRFEISRTPINAKHIRIENSRSFIGGVGIYNLFEKSRIGTLEIVGSKIEELRWQDTDIDRLVIADSEIGSAGFGSKRYTQLKISKSKIKSAFFGDAHIEALEITGSQIDEIKPYKATIGSINTGGDEALRQKILDAKQS